MPRYQEHDIFISQDVPNNRLNALVVKYQAKGMVVHLMLDLAKEPNMQVKLCAWYCGVGHACLLLRQQQTCR